MRFGNMGTFATRLSLSTAPSSTSRIIGTSGEWMGDGIAYAVRSTRWGYGDAYCVGDDRRLLSGLLSHFHLHGTHHATISFLRTAYRAYCLLPFLLAKDPRGIPNAVGAAFHVVTVDLVGLADGVPVAGR